MNTEAMQFKVEFVEQKLKHILNAVLTRLISDFGQQKDSLRETWHNLDHSIQQRGTVLELRSRRLTLGWGLRKERYMFIRRKNVMSVILGDLHMHITIILSLNVSKYYIPERG